MCVVHYSTPFMVECLIKSINKHTPNCHIYVFDNSDVKPFINTFDNVTVFDNTNKQLIDFEKILLKYPERYNDNLSNFGSFKHCISIQKCIELIDDNFVLMDSDVLIKKDISDLYQEDKIFVGEIGTEKGWVDRLCPFLCFLNINMCKLYDIKFYHDKYIFGLTKFQKENLRYDVGGYFLEQSFKYDHLLININDYIVHYHGASWKNNKIILERWLLNHKYLWSNEALTLNTIQSLDYNMVNEKEIPIKTKAQQNKKIFRNNTERLRHVHSVINTRQQFKRKR